MKTVTTWLVICVSALLALGLVMVYSASMYMGPGAGGDGAFPKAQFVWAGGGIVACMIAALVDYRRYERWVPALLVVSTVLLTLVFVPHIGIKVKGASRWIGHGQIRFQPSEIAKLAVILFLSWYIARNPRRISTFRYGVLFPALFLIVPIALIFKEPDRGTTLLLLGVSSAMLLAGGARLHHLVLPGLLILGLIGYSISHDKVRMGRIQSWVQKDTKGKGYQADQSKLALAAGGWLGSGLGEGRRKYGFVPEHHTDFILSVIGEELGLVATLGILLGFVSIVTCGLLIAHYARDIFGRMAACGITFLIGLQAFVNIGVATATLPNKGLALPFVSRGGSSLMVMLGCVGILLSIAMRASSGPSLKVPAVMGDADPFASAQPT